MRSSLIRVGLLVVGLPTAITGAWALIAPGSFFRSVPTGAAHAWVSPLGNYDEHLVRDVGALLLAIALLLVIAAVVLERRLVIIAAAVALVFEVPHLIFHAIHTAELSVRDNAINLTLLGGTVAILFAVGIAAWVEPQGSS